QRWSKAAPRLSDPALQRGEVQAGTAHPNWLLQRMLEPGRSQVGKGSPARFFGNVRYVLMNYRGLLAADARTERPPQSSMLEVEFAQLSDRGRVRGQNEDYLGYALPAAPAARRWPPRWLPAPCATIAPWWPTWVIRGVIWSGAAGRRRSRAITPSPASRPAWACCPPRKRQKSRRATC